MGESPSQLATSSNRIGAPSRQMFQFLWPGGMIAQAVYVAALDDVDSFLTGGNVFLKMLRKIGRRSGTSGFPELTV